MIRLLLCTLLLATSSLSVRAAAESPIEAFRDGLEGLRGQFTQRVFDGEGNQREESRGTIALAQPRQFRWEYEQPFPQLIVADGDHVWIYDPDLEQVTVRMQSQEEQQSPLAALIHPGELERQFHIDDRGREGGVHWLELRPRQEEDAGFERARLGFDGKELVRMELHDLLGQRTVIEFSGWRRNPGFAPGTFRFEPPEGVDVVGETRQAAEVMPLRD